MGKSGRIRFATKIGRVRVSTIRRTSKSPVISLTVNSSKKVATIMAIPDTGAEVTVVGRRIMRSLNINHADLASGAPLLRAANGTPIQTLGQFTAELSYGGRSTHARITVCDGQEEMLLSWSDCIALGILPNGFPNPLPLPIRATQTSVNDTPHHLDKITKDLLEEFKDVFDTSGSLRTMSGPLMRIELREGVETFSTLRPRPVPFAQRDKVKEALDKMVRDEVITPVSGPTDCTHPMIVAEKANGDPRICVDLTRLNRFVKRPIYPIRTPKDAVSSLAGTAKWFTTVDAAQGYHQVALHEDSQKVTTFLTPWGRFMFRRGTMGLNATGDEYCRRGDEALGDLPNTVKVVDDVLLFD